MMLLVMIELKRNSVMLRPLLFGTELGDRGHHRISSACDTPLEKDLSELELSSWFNLIMVMQLLLLSLVRVVLRLKTGARCFFACISNIAIVVVGKLINDAPVAEVIGLTAATFYGVRQNVMACFYRLVRISPTDDTAQADVTSLRRSFYPFFRKILVVLLIPTPAY